MNRRKSHFTFSPVPIFVAIVIVCCVGFGAIKVVGLFHTTDYSACKIEDKDRTTNSDGQSDARIYTSCGVFKVEDVWTRGQFNSADLYASIKRGQTYDLTTIGFRIPVLSMFPSVIDAKVVS